MNATPPIAPVFSDLQTGCEFVASIPLTNPEQAVVELNRFLDSLQVVPPDGETYFRLLEHARISIDFVAEELAKRYLNKALPLADIEEAVFQQVVSLWRKTARAYAHCAENDSPAGGDPGHVQRIAMILHRCIHHTGMAIVAHQRARREYPSGLWIDLHGYYCSADEWGIATEVIPDALDALGRNTHCAAAYISFLLGDMAGCYSLSLREQALVRRWAIYWSPLVSLHKVEPEEVLPQFVVDLMLDSAMRSTSERLPIGHLRRLDTSRLAMQISQIRQQLKQKIPPAQLTLGEDCTAGQCNRLLEHLSRPWTQARAPRKFRRLATTGIIKLCTGFEEMYYYISGKEFEQPDAYNRQEFERLFAFRHRTDPQQMLRVRQAQLGYSVEQWSIVNQSANGFRLVCSAPGKKIAHGQLLALCPHDGDRFLLAHATWLMQDKGSGLVVGVEALPGMPQAIAARPLDMMGVDNGKYHRAFLFPAIPAVGAEQSLVLPPGWFRSLRVISLSSDRIWQVRLLHVLDEGPDYERVSFAVC